MFISRESKGYKLLDPLTRKLQVSTEVVFHKEKSCKWSDSIGLPRNSIILDETLNQCDEDIVVRGSPIHLQYQPVQQNTSSSSTKKSIENPT